MDKEKEEWLSRIGAKPFPEPIKYIYSFKDYGGAFNLSERYIEETPIEELEAQYQKNKEYVQKIIEAGIKTDGFLLSVVYPLGCCNVQNTTESRTVPDAVSEDDQVPESR
ncbi:MAG: hypothetical protein LUG61_02515 [Lachnospiraceae bacterium]|nr:hypothetical protein [Lachnospiraceae bacterium]